jgi:hypothetical protein
VSTRHRDAAPPLSQEFELALASLQSVRLRPEVTVQETPAPARLAPHSVAMLGEAAIDNEEVASGRFVLLHDPDGQEPWGGRFRVVSFVRASVELEMAADPVVTEVAWAWLLEALQERGARWTLPSGTVTRTASQSFGALEDRPPVGEVEVRASWTPDDADLGPHLQAWADLLAQVGGLPPLPAGVSSLPRIRPTSR